MPIKSLFHRAPPKPKTCSSPEAVKLSEWADWAERQHDRATLSQGKPLLGGKFHLQAKSHKSPHALLRKLSSLYRLLDNGSGESALGRYIWQVRYMPGLEQDAKVAASLEALEALLPQPGQKSHTIRMKDLKPHFRTIADAQANAARAAAQKIQTDSRLAWAELVTAQPPAPLEGGLCAQFPQLFTPTQQGARVAPDLADDLAQHFAQAGGPAARPLPASMVAESPSTTGAPPPVLDPVTQSHHQLGTALLHYEETRARNLQRMNPKLVTPKGAQQKPDLAYCKAFNAALRDAQPAEDGPQFTGSALSDAQHKLQWIDDQVKELATYPAQLLRDMHKAAEQNDETQLAQLAAQYMNVLRDKIGLLNRLAQALLSPEHQSDLPNIRQGNLRWFGCMLSKLGNSLLSPQGSHAQLYALCQQAVADPAAVCAELNGGLASDGLRLDA